MSTIVEKAKLTVDELLERRHRLHTYAERVQHALDLVYMHFETENPERIDECIRLYTDDAEWEAPARRVSYKGPQRIKEMYVKLFGSSLFCGDSNDSHAGSLRSSFPASR